MKTPAASLLMPVSSAAHFVAMVVQSVFACQAGFKLKFKISDDWFKGNTAGTLSRYVTNAGQRDIPRFA